MLEFWPQRDEENDTIDDTTFLQELETAMEREEDQVSGGRRPEDRVEDMEEEILRRDARTTHFSPNSPRPSHEELAAAWLAADEASEEEPTHPQYVVPSQTRNKKSSKTRSASLQAIKDKVEEARKPKMRKVQYYLCDVCSQPILDPDEGYVIHGNIYVADTTQRGGLVGNNFPDMKEGEKIGVDDVKESVFCKGCLKRALNFDKAPKSTKRPAGFVPRGKGAASDEDVPFSSLLASALRGEPRATQDV